MQQLTIGKNQDGQRLDKFLKKAFPNAGTGFLYKMLRKKNITLNGKKAEGKEERIHIKNTPTEDLLSCLTITRG